MVYAQLALSVLELTCFFSLLGLAYLVVLEGSGFFNLAIGPYAMLGALALSYLVREHEVPLAAGAVVVVLVVVLVAAATDLLVVRPIERRSEGSSFPALVAIAALVFGLSQVAGLVFGRLPLPGQRILTFPPVSVGDVFVSAGLVLLVALTAVVFTGVTVAARVTSFGRALRAVGDNREAAAILGLSVGRVRLTAFVLSGAIACAAGVAFAAKGGVSYDIGLHWALLGFLALVIGGTGSWFAPVLGGLALACLQVLVPYRFGGEYADYAVLAFALLFFALRPQGLFAREVRA